MVEVVGHKLKTHHPVIEPVSDIRVGNGIFRCRDGGSRSAFLSCRDSRGDKDELEKARCSRDKCTDHPRSSIPEDCVVETVGLELVTHHPVIEPSLRQSRERKFLMQRQAGKNGLFTPQRPVQRLASYTKSPHSSALNAIRASEVRALKTGWWAHQGSNLGPAD